jgi:peroxiredoxin Q/BCP
MPRLEVGETAPDFTLADHDGQSITLEALRGQRVVLYFYPADDTPGCTKEACQFNEALEAFSKTDTDVLGISPDGAESHRKFRSKYGLGLTLLSDPDHVVMERYGAYGEKTLYGRKTVGVIRSTFVIGPDGTIEQAWYNVRADGHAAKVLATVGG